MRQLHRVIASLLDRALAPTEVQRFSRLARAAKKWAQNAGDFKKVIDDIVQLSKKKQRRGSGLSSEQDSMSEQGYMSAFNDATCSGSEAGYMTPFSGGKECQMGASGKRGVDLAPLEVAWLSAREFDELGNRRSL